MSCDAVAAVFLYFAAGASAPQGFVTPAVAVAPAAPVSVASEPLFAEIVGRARGLNLVVKDYRTKLAASGQLPDIGALQTQVAELSALDMKGHLTLAERGTDGDLKCILKGISQDLTVKMADLKAATAKDARDKALAEMSYLLVDNVEVILAPPAPPV